MMPACFTSAGSAMEERRKHQRFRVLRAGKIVLNKKGSVLDCRVRNLSDEGACLDVSSVVGIPDTFGLLIDGESAHRDCSRVWQSENRIGVRFALSGASRARHDEGSNAPEVSPETADERPPAGEIVRGDLFRLRAALDQVTFGIVLLDKQLRAQFINRAYRKMWQLPDCKADAKPAFVSLIYHGRDTRAYDVPDGDINAFVAERVAHVSSGDPVPRDLRLRNGDVLRVQCAVLPDGGRMLSYTYVTDIVRHADELETLHSALDNVSDGIILLDAQLNAQFMNRSVRKLWGVADEQAARKPSYSQLVNDSRRTGTYGVPARELDAYIARRIASVRAGDPQPADLRTHDGRTIRAQCTVLPGGGRMLTYTDVTDLVRHSQDFERQAKIDGMTGLFNKGHFRELAEAEWDRFQRYHRPLSLLIVDIDHFKGINDRYGHDMGDKAIVHLSDWLRKTIRKSDVAGRIGGDEFAVLLPESDLAKASLLAERLRGVIRKHPLTIGEATLSISLSIGAAQATVSQPGVAALVKLADEGLYLAKTRGRDQLAAVRAAPPPDYKTAAE
jgi:diguanylate cyclase (GGDEF)-like protein